VNIDLSLISPYDYYNGPIFKGYINGNPKDVFRGGRYDTLTQTYGTSTKALGFSLDMAPLMKEVF
jgi:ATP phosphoribosyltransferase regulatory subunit